MSGETQSPPIKAMVSYAWGSEAHQDRVKMLVDQLRGDSIDVIFDKYHLRDGDDVNAFMEQVAAQGDVQKVMAICDPQYVRKMNAREGGSGQEGMIMSARVYEQLRSTLKSETDLRGRRFIAVIFERDPDLPDNDPGHLPTMFGSMKYIDMSTPERYDQNYDQLLRFLADRPELIAPPLGPLPSHLRADAPPALPGHSQFLSVKRLLEQGKPALGAWRDYLEQLELALRSVQPATEPGRDQPVFRFEVMLEETRRLMPVRDEFVEALRLSLKHDSLPMDELLAFFERVMRLSSQLGEAHRSSGGHPIHSTCYAHADVLVMELTLYLTAVLVEGGQVEALQEFTEHTFFYQLQGQTLPATFRGLQHIADQSEIERTYNLAARQDWSSPLGDWLKERATLQSVPWAALAQAELLLMLKSAFQRRAGAKGGLWACCAGPYWMRLEPPPLFRRFASRKRLQPWLPFFGAADAAQLKTELTAAFPADSFNQLLKDSLYSASMEGLLNTEQWGTLN